MGLTKQYLRFAPAGSFNIISSTNCNCVFITLENQEGRYVAVGACEHVIIWDLRLGEKTQVLCGESSPVTCLCSSPNKRDLAVGYADGNVQVFNLETTDVICTFSGHSSAISTLSYDLDGHRLASGAKDTEIILWDTVAEEGICRLSDHKGVVTQVAFMAQHNVLISAAKDTFVKFWDLDTQHCFKTIVLHISEVWGLCLMKEDRYLVTGCADTELRVWKICHRSEKENQKKSINDLAMNLEVLHLEDAGDPDHPIQCHKVGSLIRSGRGRVCSMFCDSTAQVLGCSGIDNQLELFYFCEDVEANRRLKKRQKRERKKRAGEDSKEPTVEPETTSLSLADEVRRLPAIKLLCKLNSFDLVLGRGELRISLSLVNNTLELYSLAYGEKHAEPKCLRSLSVQGHRTIPRSVCFSSDNLGIVSGSGDSLKLWNRPTQSCIRTIATGYVLSTCFVPGDRHVVAGLMDGRLLIVDISAGDILEEISAHSGELWSICLMPDLRGVVTGGGDKTVKFWKFELVKDESRENAPKVLSLLHTRTLKVDDTVLCVCLSPNGKFIAVALLDSTVKIFFVDSLKFFLSLYGHKLPVLCMDISSDSTKIATGSGDRNVKIWGMDFGDCHKSIFAHDGSVTGLKFIPSTHQFFTCGKDGKVKQWDADTYDKIITLQGHSGECHGLSVSPSGIYVVSCGADKSLRLYDRTEEILVLQDEAEEEREREEQTLATGERATLASQPGLNLPSRKTVGSEKGAENILECLEVCAEYAVELKDHRAIQASSEKEIPLPQPPPLMQALQVTSINDLVLETIRRIRSSDLEEALVLVPFTSVCEMLKLLPPIAESGVEIELVSKLVIFLLRIHHSAIIANHTMVPVIQKLNTVINEKVNQLRDLIGYNLHGLQYIQREIESSEGVQLFRDATIEKKKKDVKRKRKHTAARSILTLTT